MNEIWQT